MKIKLIINERSKGILYYLENLKKELDNSDEISVSIENYSKVSFATCDIIHFHFSNSTRNVLFAVPFFRSKVKVCTVHDVIPRTKKIPLLLTKFIYKYLNLFIDSFIVHSEFAKKILLEVAPIIPQNKVSVIPHGCTVLDDYNVCKLREKYGFSETDVILLMAGFIKKIKGQLEVIKIFRELNLNNVKLIIVGKLADKESEIELQNLHDENIHYFGFVGNEKLLDFIKLSDVLINYRLESVGESSGPMLIAIGAGKPIICSNVGSFPEVIKDAGLVVGSKEYLKENIFKFCTDNNLRERLQGNVKRLRENYSWTNIARRHIILYEKLKYSHLDF